ncbi:MAG TPA: carboxymuconolactone decarboxylase family protein [Stellaceae bacterium]|nr:carboxymuconolactone decarboxylase family protein [Stellaceae bacterium]
MNDEERRAAGSEMRRKVLGNAYVDRAIAKTTPFSQEIRDFIVRYAWGEVWTRPGLDHRTRRLLVMGTMMALGRWDEFQLHVRTALEGGMDLDDIKEVILQQAVYCGVPAANTAINRVEELLAETASAKPGR